MTTTARVLVARPSSTPAPAAPAPTALELAAVRKGDRIVAVDGRRLPVELVVLQLEPRAIRVAPIGRATAVEWRLYLDQHEAVEVVPPVDRLAADAVRKLRQLADAAHAGQSGGQSLARLERARYLFAGHPDAYAAARAVVARRMSLGDRYELLRRIADDLELEA